MKKNLSLYIHIPFCNSKCNYCNFVSQVGDDNEKNRYILNLKTEIKLQAKLYNSFYCIRSIYIGGGTPSCLKLGQIKEILQTIYKYFSVNNDAEITMELNPNSVSNEKIREYILSGVNRFSIGLQCVDKDVLKSMGRTHILNDFDNTINLIREHGISNISSDIILGFPNQNNKHVIDSINHLLNLEIPHISSYMLSVEEGTPLQTMIKNGNKVLPSETQTIKMYQSVCNLLRKNGYSRYEVSNFAKPGFICKHNLVYWRREDYLGFGVSSHSYIDGVRFSNTEKIKLYNECIEKKLKAPINKAHKLTIKEKKEEFIMLSLRTLEGLDTELYKTEFKENFLIKHKETLTNFIKLKLLTINKSGVIRATSSGFLVLNKIILELCTEI